MRMWFWIVAAIMLAACATVQNPASELPTLMPQNAGTPTNEQATPVGNQTDTTPADTTQGEVATLSPVEREVAALPPPGTLVTVPVTEEAEPGAASSPFFSITYEESGGPADTSLQIEIRADGTVTRNGDAVSVSPEIIAGVEQQLDELHFFNIQGQFTMPGAGSDIYEYMVRVELQDGSAKRLKAQDGLTPPELLRLFSTLRQIGE